MTESEKSEDCFTELKKFKNSNLKNVIIGHLNVNSLRNKIETLKPVIDPFFDIFLVSETKLDDSFPNNEFCIPGYRMFRLDRNRYGGGLCFYVNDNIFCKQLNNHNSDTCIEAMFLEVRIKSRKWLLIGAYKPPNQSDNLFLDNISTNLTFYSKYYENFIILGDLNMNPQNKLFQDFQNTFCLGNLIKEATCFKSTPSSIDVIITNNKSYFKGTCVVATGISDFHKLTAASLKAHLGKGVPRIKLYRDYKNFNKNHFKRELKNELESITHRTYSNFEASFTKVLNKHAPLKIKTLRANHSSFMTKTLRKAIMRRSHLKNKYLKNRSNENWKIYKKQRNFCTNLLKKN